MLQQFRVRHVCQIRKSLPHPARRRHAHHVASLRAVVSERRAFPARNVELPAAVHVHVGGAHHVHELFLACFEARAVRGERMAHNAAAAPLDGVKPAPEAVGKPRFIHEERAARRATAVIRQRLNHFVAEFFVERGVAVFAAQHDVREAHIPAVAVVGVVAREEIHLGGHGHVVNVPLAVRDEFQAGAVWPHAHDAAAVELQARAVLADGIRRAVIANRDVEEAINAHPHPVHRVVRAAKFQIEAQSAHEHVGAVAHAVAVVIGERCDERRVHDVERLVVEPDAARRIHGGEGDELVRLSVAVGVGAAHYATAIGLGVDGTVLVDAHVEVAIRRGAQAGRVADIGLGGEHRHLPAGGHLDALRNLGGKTRRGGERQREANFRKQGTVHQAGVDEGVWVVIRRRNGK